MGRLFQLGNFTFNSGIRSRFKIECDELSNDSIAALACVGAHQVCHFGRVLSVPKGKSGSPIDNAKRFADALAIYARHDSTITLLVDDVWTTGGSMESFRAHVMRGPYRWTVGWVAVAYKMPASWVTPCMLMAPTVGLMSC